MRRTTRAAGRYCISLALICMLTSLGWAQPRRRGPRPSGPATAPSKAGAAGGSKSQAKAGKIKPYDEVITDEAKSKRGVFLVHRIKEKLYYEIPTSQLNKDMLWVVQLERTQAGFSYGGMPVRNRVVRWELRNEKVLLRDVKYTIRANAKGSIQTAVAATSMAPIIKVLPVVAWGKDKAPVVDATSLFTTDVTEFSAARSLGASGMDTSRTFLDEVKAFPRNIETKVLASYRLGGSSARPSTSRRASSAPRHDPSQSAVTVLLHHSMLLLPENPMQPRVHDPRVGFFTTQFENYGEDRYHEVEETRYITRWRLEKKNPDADVSEVKKPIVFYVGRGVPEKWKPYIKQAIEAWQPAFEKAGFKNAIQAKLAPSVHEDPDWDAEDARISTIRWLPATVENAFGPHIHDPRTGEILEADVRVYHNVLKLARDWYFVQASPNDKHAQKLPLPDALMGKLLTYVVAHEVGHSLGFPHNMKASSAFTVANLRSREFTKKNGTEASIMDYGRFNYVAQPGDGAALIPKIGPYDFFAVQWGYRQYKNKKDEEKGRAKLLTEQVANPVLLFGDADAAEDPTRQTEDLGSDSTEATRLGLLNIDRVAGYLVQACCKKNKDYSLLENMYDQLLSQRTRELMHVAAVVGGFEQRTLFFGDAPQIYFPVSAERQQKAVRFLSEHALRTPRKLIDPKITLRLEASGVADRVLESQVSVLKSLLRDSRLKRMAEHAAMASATGEKKIYSPSALLTDLRKATWSELGQKTVRIDLFRRNLQRAYFDLLAQRDKSTSTDSDLPALARLELKWIHSNILSALKKSDPVSRAHLEQVAATIKSALDTRVVQVRQTSAPTPFPPRRAARE